MSSTRHPLSMTTMRSLSLLFLLLEAPTCLSFVPPPSPTTFWGVTNTALQQHADDADNNMDDLRNMLESSWDVESMGQVPSSPEVAAEEAAASIRQARDDGLGNLCFVDLLLPQYDIQQGSNLYDEVEAVNFCRLVSKCLHTQAVIYVKDEKSLNTVKKVLDAREANRETEEQPSSDEEVDAMIDENDEERTNELGKKDAEESEDIETTSVKDEPEVDIFDDFSDFGEAGGESFFSLEPMPAPSTDADTFREKLSSSWAGDEKPKEGKEKKRTKVVKKLVKRKVEQLQRTTPKTEGSRPYRLASLFGNNVISQGATMSNDVVKAIKAHGLPKKEEETLILLSANSEAEMLAVRALVAKYMDSKNIILVNCRLNELPRELEKCDTVYHLTPLVATSTLDERNIFGKEKKDEERPPIKVVSIRRYPGQWEVYVDADGKGFELAQRTAATKFQNKGPSFDWIGGVIKTFLSARS